VRAEEFMKALDEMDNAERIKLLSWLFDKYFDNRPPKHVIEEELEKEIWGEDDE